MYNFPTIEYLWTMYMEVRNGLSECEHFITRFSLHGSIMAYNRISHHNFNFRLILFVFDKVLIITCSNAPSPKNEMLT